MKLNGSLLIAGSERRGSNGEFSAVEAASGQPLPVAALPVRRLSGFHGGTPACGTEV